MTRVILPAARAAVLILFVSACADSSPAGPGAEPELAPAASSVRIPLTDNPTGTYFGFKRGLYNGSNTMPARHVTDGMAAARRVQPLDAQGNPSPSGNIVVLSVGMSSARQEFCGKRSTGGTCNSWTFGGLANADPQKSPAVVLVNGADGAQPASVYESPASPSYGRIRTELAAQNVTEAQVQVVWLKVVNKNPVVPLPAANADAFNLQRSTGNILRTLKVVYPNLQQVFLSSRIYAGYTTATNNPEPYAYESGFAMAWTVAAQVRQILKGTVDPLSGNLDHRTVAPWVAWGPYMWADGTTPRSDGLTWVRGDFETDGFHPSQAGETKVGQFLHDFFTQSPFTSCWFRGVSC